MNDHFVPLVMNNVSFETCNFIFCTVPDIASKAEEWSPLYHACNALRHAYLGNLTWSPIGISNQSSAYGTALAVKSALQDPQQWKSDKTLLSI
jgi:hypothetical protein